MLVRIGIDSACKQGKCTQSQLPLIQPTDPNNLVGFPGLGSQGWIAGAQVLPHAVSFDNVPSATAPAQQVVVTQPLGANVNLSTLSLLGITIPNGSSDVHVPIPPNSFSPAAGIDEFTTNVDLRPTQGLLVNVDAKLNRNTKTLTWTFTSIDPNTGLPPFNPLFGFLPAGAEANFSFSVTPTPGLATGAQIAEQATVVFDGQAPMSTQNWVNTIDNTPPSSQVTALPATETSTSFTVQWAGTDAGSGMQGFTIYVSDSGGPFSAFQMNTAATSATFTGQVGHTYAFYSIATDLVGNIEGSKSNAETTTTVTLPPACATDLSSSVSIIRSGYVVNFGTQRFYQTVTLKNTSSSTINGPISLVLDSLSSNASLYNTSGTTSCAAPLGRPYISTSTTSLAPGASVSVSLQFTDPTKATITYNARVLAGSGAR